EKERKRKEKEGRKEI
ncbi:hypothetical protein L345_17932, partial [Ophiophagus hannah]